MFINFSNHPSVRWSAEQTAAAIEFGDIVDVPFPDVLPPFPHLPMNTAPGYFP